MFHVSPFIKVEGCYPFRFLLSAERLAVPIGLHDEDGFTLSTGWRENRSIHRRGHIYYFFRYPPVTLKIVALIHDQAAIFF